MVTPVTPRLLASIDKSQEDNAFPAKFLLCTPFWACLRGLNRCEYNSWLNSPGRPDGKETEFRVCRPLAVAGTQVSAG
jgi:hypothetical protein